ncbi:MAG: tRNA (adenosine(37)-N6)-threonylcarbamoyltransferase complex ATPase subunit type 1 TsaE [Patescibacteria group bacterium]
MEVLSKSLAETKAVAKDFLVKLVNPEFAAANRGATVVGLHGDLGSGKTTFTQAAAESLGIKDRVTSPTFVIMKKYEITKPGGDWKYLIHIDAYRLEKAEELAKLNWSELVEDQNNLILIEWPERVAEVLPPNLISINFKFIDEVIRQISYE